MTINGLCSYTVVIYNRMYSRNFKWIELFISEICQSSFCRLLLGFGLHIKNCILLNKWIEQCSMNINLKLCFKHIESNKRDFWQSRSANYNTKRCLHFSFLYFIFQIKFFIQLLGLYIPNNRSTFYTNL